MAKEGAKEMAELLRSGAKMLSYNCPQCGSPLFQLKSGEVWCARCKRRVVIVPETEDESKAATGEALWESLERTILGKISVVYGQLSAESDPEGVGKLSNVLASLLESLERVRRLRKG